MAVFPLFFLSNSFMAFDTARAAFEGTLLTNFSKASLVEGIAYPLVLS